MFLDRLIATTDDVAFTIARVALGVMVLPHGMQKVFGSFGGFGFEGTMRYWSENMHIPYLFGLLAVAAEFLGGLALLAGFLGRLAGLGVAYVMIVAVFTTHAQYGFFMNWGGQQKGEGFEFHILALGLALVVTLKGSGAFSIDRLLMTRRRFRSDVPPAV